MTRLAVGGAVVDGEAVVVIGNHVVIPWNRLPNSRLNYHIPTKLKSPMAMAATRGKTKDNIDVVATSSIS